MNPFKLKLNSWHYFLATFGNKYRVSRHGEDICHYIRSVLIGGLQFLFMIVFGILVGLLVGFTIGNFIGWLFLGYKLEQVTIGIGSVMLGISLPIGVVYLIDKYQEWNFKRISNDEYVEPEPGFISLAYKRFKEKTCVWVEFE